MKKKKKHLYEDILPYDKDLEIKKNKTLNPKKVVVEEFKDFYKEGLKEHLERLTTENTLEYVYNLQQAFDMLIENNIFLRRAFQDMSKDMYVIKQMQSFTDLANV